MTVDDLIDKLLMVDGDLPVTYQGPEYATGIPVEISAVARQAWIPEDALVARTDVCLIKAAD